MTDNLFKALVVEETDDKKINVQINLLGLGGIRY
mgnify:CR=1 FL=1